MTEPLSSLNPAPESRAGGRLSRRFLLRAGLVGAILCAGCLRWHPAPVDLSDPAWRIRRGQVVWHPADRDLELVGDLLGATTRDGRGYAHFSKSPLLVAEVRVEPDRWLASFPFMDRRFQGSGSPPDRLAWAQWIRAAQGQPPTGGWTFSGDLDGSWRLAHADSGEWLEGVAEP
ncbi:MAG: hypothetical protein AB7O66_12515 [Limisphaerales bacterium]